MLAVSVLLIPLGALAGTAQPFRCTPTHSHARSSPVSPLRLSVTLSLSLSRTLARPLSLLYSCQQPAAPTTATQIKRSSPLRCAARSPPTLLYVFLGLFSNLSVPILTESFFCFLILTHTLTMSIHCLYSLFSTE